MLRYGPMMSPRRSMMKAVTLAAVCAFGLTACAPSFVTNDQADVLLTVVKLSGNAGAGPNADEDSDFLLSDVVTEGGVINDNAVMTLRVDPKNPNLGQPGVFNNVRLTQYRVSYTRTDGHNAEGIDVPYSFSGPLATEAVVGAETGVAFVAVRHQAKREPPLRNMWGGGGHEILQTIATITVFGQTAIGQAVTAQGQLEVTFADFADD